MFSAIALSAAFLGVSTFAAPNPVSSAPSSNTTLLPLYVNGINVNKTTFSAQNLTNVPPFHPSPTQSATPPDPYTYLSSTINVTIVRQDAAAPSFHIPAPDAQFFAAFVYASFAQQNASHESTNSLPNSKLDIGAKLVGETGGDHTVHVTVVRDPMTAKGEFVWKEGGVVAQAFLQWTRLWARGSFVGCAGVLVQDGGDMVAQGSFCGASA